MEPLAARADAHDDVVLEAEPTRRCGGFDTPGFTIRVDDFQTHVGQHLQRPIEASRQRSAELVMVFTSG